MTVGRARLYVECGQLLMFRNNKLSTFYFSFLLSLGMCDLLRTERDVSGWSSERLRQLLLGVRVEGPEGVCHLTDISKLDGEASINNRKGKLIFFYEWQLRASWLGQ